MMAINDCNLQDKPLTDAEWKDLLTAVFASGREAAIDEFSTHVPAKNPYSQHMQSEEYFAWLEGYFAESNSIAANYDITPLSEIDWGHLMSQAQSGRYAALCA